MELPLRPTFHAFFEACSATAHSTRTIVRGFPTFLYHLSAARRHISLSCVPFLFRTGRLRAPNSFSSLSPFPRPSLFERMARFPTSRRHSLFPCSPPEKGREIDVPIKQKGGSRPGACRSVFLFFSPAEYSELVHAFLFPCVFRSLVVPVRLDDPSDRSYYRPLPPFGLYPLLLTLRCFF